MKPKTTGTIVHSGRGAHRLLDSIMYLEQSCSCRRCAAELPGQHGHRPTPGPCATARRTPAMSWYPVEEQRSPPRTGRTRMLSRLFRSPTACCTPGGTPSDYRPSSGALYRRRRPGQHADQLATDVADGPRPPDHRPLVFRFATCVTRVRAGQLTDAPPTRPERPARAYRRRVAPRRELMAPSSSSAGEDLASCAERPVAGCSAPRSSSRRRPRASAPDGGGPAPSSGRSGLSRPSFSVSRFPGRPCSPYLYGRNQAAINTTVCSPESHRGLSPRMTRPPTRPARTTCRWRPDLADASAERREVDAICGVARKD